MKTRIFLVLINSIIINISIIVSYFVRYGYPFPERNFLPFKSSFIFLTSIYILSLIFFGVYKERFKSSWELFRSIFFGVFFGTLISVAFVYIFRKGWGAFPTSIFSISSFINLLLIFKVDQFVLRRKKRIKKQVIIIGDGRVDDIVSKKAYVERKRIEQIKELAQYRDVDEIIISDKIGNKEDINLLVYIAQRLKSQIFFSSAVYLAVLSEKINGGNSLAFLSTFVGRKSDLDEFLIRVLDISGSLILLLIFSPLMLFVSLLNRISSPGPVFYKQKRVGKDGKIFTLYKFRTMVSDAEKIVGPVLAQKDDPRITSIGKFLRPSRLDELPQLFNVLRGDMSLVGPRPEREHFVKRHKALREIRLAVKPGITGLAQIRSFYDLKPKHKIKYDYLYIQRRTLALNIYILLQTIPVMLLKKGW
jgi:exopolysaccharide biosynthesis polyprenyl glycosylphosphotransferase